jgi:uncharacterized protein YndB with AHSA1/START domain
VIEHRYAEIQGDCVVRRVALSNTLNAPIETVWQAITNVEQIQHWWPDWRPGGVIDKAEGGTVRLGDGSWIDGIVKVWRPPHIFEFTWQEHPDETPDWFEARTSSLLRIDLVELSNSQTLLNLIQFAPEQSAVGGTAGWHHFAGERLKCLLETGMVEDTSGRFDVLVKLYSV